MDFRILLQTIVLEIDFKQNKSIIVSVTIRGTTGPIVML